MTFSGTTRSRLRRRIAAACARVALAPAPALAGAQVEEQLAPSVVAGLQRAIADNPVPADYADRAGLRRGWRRCRRRLAPRVPDARDRATNSLATVHYEARARRARSAARARRDPARERVPQVRDLVRRRARLHAGDAVLDEAHRHARAQSVPPAHEPALRLRDPAPLSRHRERRPLSARSAATTAASASPSIPMPCWRR